VEKNGLVKSWTITGDLMVVVVIKVGMRARSWARATFKDVASGKRSIKLGVQLMGVVDLTL